MKTLRSNEGYFMRDDRASGGSFVEAPTYTCSHCQAVVVMNPDRQRPRAHCRGCNHYICDPCSAVIGCNPFKRTVETTLERAVRGLPTGVLLNG